MSATELIERVFSFFEPVVHFFSNLGLPHNTVFYAVFGLLAILWVGFALWGARTAGQAGRSRIVNFIIGLAIPIVYACLLPRMIRRQRQQQRAQVRKEEDEQRKRKIPVPPEKRHRVIGATLQESEPEEDLPAKPRTGDTQLFAIKQVGDGGAGQDEEAVSPEEHRDFFVRQMREQKGGQPQKICIVYGDNVIHSRRIIEITPKFVVVEAKSKRVGKREKIQSLRIPFNRISKVENLNQTEETQSGQDAVRDNPKTTDPEQGQ